MTTTHNFHAPYHSYPDMSGYEHNHASLHIPLILPLILQDGYQHSLELVSLLLGYPDTERSTILRTLNCPQQRVRRIPRLDAVLATFAHQITPLKLVEWQALYVQSFDLDPASSLHLTWHVYGDSPRQGRALAAINEVYREAGFKPVPGELPDYLPMMLEFMAVAPAWATHCLGEKFGPIMARLAAHLGSQDNPYAPLLEHVLEVLGISPYTSEVTL